MTPHVTRRGLGDLLAIALMVALLGAVYLLPPDTSLAEVRRAGLLAACVPEAYPPLVTGDPARPGLDVELLTAATERIGVSLVLTVVPEMGRDFNPRAWHVTRAQCQVFAGGVVDTLATRSFLDVTRPHAETGWTLVAPGEPPALEGAHVGVLVGTSGIDRLALSRALRAARARAEIVASPDALAAGIADGRFDLGVAEALVARPLAADRGWTAAPFPPLPDRYPLVFGLWKGDLTLKRALDHALAALEADGTADRLRAAYLGQGFAEREQA